ncbi:MAG: hypothetical protein WC209_09675 [Ignavibacteriaceae bacterium]|jgi:hypothetical protein
MDLSSVAVPRSIPKMIDSLELIHFGIQLKYRTYFKQIALGIIGLIGVSLILIITNPHGAGLTPDSVAYISAARNLSEGNGFLTYNGLHLVIQPPLYSLLLALIKKITSVDPQIAAGYVNALLFGAIIYLSGLLLLRYLKSFVLIILGTVSVIISYALVQASFMALSELLFIFLVLLFLYYFGKYQIKRDFVSLFLFSTSVSLACLTRYTGVIIILTGVLCIVFFTENQKKEKFRHSVIFLFITVFPITLWIIRNYFISGTLTGLRAPSSYTFFENISFFYYTVLSWYFPLNLAGIYFVFIFLIVSTWILFGRTPAKFSIGEVFKLIGPSFIFIVCYSWIIVVSSTTTAYDKISDRLLSPIYIPLLFTLFFLADKILRWLRTNIHQKSVTLLFVSGIILLMIFPAKNTIQITEEFTELSGWGFSSYEWRENKTIEYLNQHKLSEKNYKFYSNEPEAVYILTGLTTMCSPPKRYYNSPQLFDITGNPEESWVYGEDVCLVWLDNSTRNHLFTVNELQKKIKMTEVVHLKDGEIYTFSIHQREFGQFMFKED